MTIHVAVTQKDIEIGKPNDICFCPAAIAIKRALKGRRIRFVALNEMVLLTMSHEPVIIQTPEAALAFMGRVDNGQPVQPIEFELTLP